MYAASGPDAAPGRYGSTLRTGARVALAPSSAPVDGRDLPQLMCMVGEFAALFNYTALDGSADGDWREFFSRDPSFVLARALCFDTAGELDQLETIVHGERDPKKRDFRLLGRLWKLQDTVNGWALALRAISAPRPLGTSASLTLEQLIRTVLAPLYAGVHEDGPWCAVLRGMQSRHATGSPDDLCWLDQLWKAAGASTLPMPKLAAGRHACAERPHPLHQVYLAVVQVIEQAKQPLRRCFDETLEHSFGHQPHTALMAAFLQLLQHAQADANALTGRHLDFYFGTVLRLRAAAPTAGRALLSFRALPAGSAARLAAGTLLKAGSLAGGQALMFALDSALTVYHDTVAALKTLRVTVAARPRSAGAVVRIRADAQAGVVSRACGTAWPPFGSDRAAPDATVGVLLTTPMLLLKGGRRNLRVRFQYAQRADGTAQASFDAVTQAYHDAVAEAMGDVPGLSHDALVAQAMSDACEVWLTTAAGWQRAPVVSVCGDAGAAWLELMLVLAPDFPPVVAGPPAKDEAGGASPWPRLKIMLRPEARVFPYTYLQQLQLQGVSVRARVSGLTPARVTVNQAAQPAGQPFYPFGNLPVLGAALEVSDPELSGKTIVRGGMTLVWANLPPGADDLAKRYAGYATPALTNNAFKASLAIERQGRWSRLGEERTLFTALDVPTAPLCGQVAFALTPAQGRSQPWSALRLVLSSPAGAFGQDRYPQLIMEASLRTAAALGDEVAAAARNAGGTLLPPMPMPAMPRAPLAPQAQRITLSYLASESLEAERAGAAPDGAQACYYQLGPFGHRAAAPQGSTLMDGLERPGQLYIGLRDLVPGQALALLFGMRGTARQQEVMRRNWAGVDGSAAPTTKVDWYYLKDNAWQPFAAAAILSDGTGGLTSSGVLRLQTPLDGPTEDNTLLPGGLRWIAAAVDMPEAHGDIVQIDTQGASATQVLEGPGTQAAPALPANSIAGFASKPADIQGVLQAAPTLPGRPAESANDFQRRVSRRLRHKQRAVSAIDFEQLVLSSYPEIFQVKCLNAAARPAPGVAPVPVPPGVVGLVVVPHAGAAAGDPGAPVVTVGLLLEIQKWLAQHASAALRSLRAFSPQYEELKVCVQLDLTGETDAAACRLRIDAAMSAWLAPWRHDDSALPIGGDGRTVDDLAAWLDGEDGVTRVTALKVLHVHGDGGQRQARWLVRGQRLAPSVPWAVLVPAAHHAIGTGDQTAYGIGVLGVGRDAMSLPEPPPGPVPAAGLRTRPRVSAPVRLPVAGLPMIR